MSTEDLANIQKLVKDLRTQPLMIAGVRGVGKSTLAKRLVKELMAQGTICIVLDNSGSWYLQSPLTHRLRATEQNIESLDIKPNSVVDLMGIDSEHRLKVFSTLCQNLIKERGEILFTEGSEGLKRLPWLVIVLEEANTYLSTYSLMPNNKVSTAIKDFCSIGRNLKLSYIAITTRSNSVSTEVRERASLLLGKLSASNEAMAIGRATNRLVRDKAKALEPYQFASWDGSELTIIKPDYEQFPEPTNTINTMQLMQQYRDLDPEPQLNGYEILIKSITGLTYLFIIVVFLWVIL